MAQEVCVFVILSWPNQPPARATIAGWWRAHEVAADPLHEATARLTIAGIARPGYHLTVTGGRGGRRQASARLAGDTFFIPLTFGNSSDWFSSCCSSAPGDRRPNVALLAHALGEVARLRGMGGVVVPDVPGSHAVASR